MKLSLSLAARLSAGNSSMRGKLSAAFPGRKVLFAFFEVSDHSEDKIEVTPQKITEVKNRIKPLFRTKARDASTKKFSKADALVIPALPLSRTLRDSHIEKREMIIVPRCCEAGGAACRSEMAGG